jgi:4-amino-4-deoxy-L-arabinose transferase-like glycosyltransferase
MGLFPFHAKRKQVTQIASGLLLIPLCAFLFFYQLGERDLWSSHEARAAQNAAMILQTGNWGLPQLFDGHREMQKPPLYYWLVAWIAQQQGGRVDAWAVRLPAAISALLGVLLVFGVLASRGRPVAGLVAALVLATAAHYTWLARVGRIDMPLMLTVSLALICFYVAGSGRIACFVGYLAIAAGIMLKGPIGAALPIAVLTVRAMVEGTLAPRRLLRSSLWWGVPLVLALTVPWFLWVNHTTHGEFFHVFFVHHNIERSLGNSDDLRVHPWWFYGPRWLIDFLPWSLLVLGAGVYLLRKSRWREDPEARFGLVWFLTMIALLSCAGFKRADYLLPAYPGAALLLGCVAERWYQGAIHPRRLAVTFGLIVAACVAAWGVVLHHVLPQQEPALEQRTFAQAIRQYAPQPDFVHFFRAESHALAFHVGYPIDTFLEWENLDIWAKTPGVHYIVMPVDAAAEWQEHVTAGRLVEVLRNTDIAAGIPPHEQMVLMRTDNPPASMSR